MQRRGAPDRVRRRRGRSPTASTRVADLVRAQRGSRPGRAARAVGARRLRLPRPGSARGQPVDGADRHGDGRGRPRRRGHAARRLDRRAPAGRANAARRARTSGTPRWSSRADGDLLATYRKIHRFGFGAGEPKLMEAGERASSWSTCPDGCRRRRCRAGLSTCYDLRFPELYRAPARRRRDGVRHPGRVAGGAGRALDPAGPRPRHREPVRRHRLQHGGHPRRHRDGRALAGRLADRRGAGRRRDATSRCSASRSTWPP